MLSYRFYTRRLRDRRFTLSLEGTFEHRSVFQQVVYKYLTGTDNEGSDEQSHQRLHHVLLNACRKYGIVETISFEGNQVIEHAAYGDNRHYGESPWKRLFCSACRRYWYLEDHTYTQVQPVYRCPVCALVASITETSSASPGPAWGKFNGYARKTVTYPLGTHLAKIDVSQQLVLLAGTQASISLSFEEAYTLLDVLSQYRQHFYEAVHDDALPSHEEMQALRYAEEGTAVLLEDESQFHDEVHQLL